MLWEMTRNQWQDYIGKENGSCVFAIMMEKYRMEGAVPEQLEFAHFEE